MSARDRDALLLATGQLARVCVQLAFESKSHDRRAHVPCFVPGHPTDLHRREDQVGEHRQVRK